MQDQNTRGARSPRVSARACVRGQQLLFRIASVALLATLLWGCEAADKSHSLTLMNQGVAHFGDANYPKAVEKLQESVKVWPKNDKAFFMLGQIYQFKYQQPEQAQENYDEATKLKPDDARYWYYKGATLVDLDNTGEAEIALSKAIQLNPTHAESHYRLGLLYEKKAQPVEAARSYGESVKSNPRSPFAYYNLGDLYFRNGRFEEALQVFKNGTGNNPEYAELHHGLGVAYLSLTRHREALIEFEEALSLKKSYPSALYNLGMTYQALGENTKAKAYLEKFISTAVGGDNAARIAAAEARLLQIKEAEEKRQ